MRNGCAGSCSEPNSTCSDTLAGPGVRAGARAGARASGPDLAEAIARLLPVESEDIARQLHPGTTQPQHLFVIVGIGSQPRFHLHGIGKSASQNGQDHNGHQSRHDRKTPFWETASSHTKGPAPGR